MEEIKVNEIRVNDYVRTKEGLLFKVNEYWYYECLQKLDNDTKSKLTKHSPNIIDLIEVGDYVNGKYVFDVFEKDGKKYLKVDCMYGYYSEDEIGEVVTHEQFDSIKYEVE